MFPLYKKEWELCSHPTRTLLAPKLLLHSRFRVKQLKYLAQPYVICNHWVCLHVCV